MATVQPKNEARMKGSTRDFVYQTLKKRIIELELKPKTKISEYEVAAELEVSRTPVREAFLMLAQEDLIGIFPQKGTVISEIDLALVEEGRFVRENIERAIVREACVSFGEEQLFQLESNLAMQQLCLSKGTYNRLFELDEEFHRLLFEGCGKLRTWRMLRQMNTHFDRLRVLRLSANTDWNVVVSQHQKIFSHISDREVELAEKLIIEHLNLVNIEKEQLKLHYADYFK